MAMNVAPVLIVAGLGLAVFGGGKKSSSKKKKLPATPPPAPPAEDMVIRWDEGSWLMPEGWLEEYATPRVRQIVFPLNEANEPFDATVVTYELLKGQTNGFPLPPSPSPPEGEYWQTDVPNATNFYDGPEAVLGLFYHVREYVDEALGRWKAGDDLYLVDFDVEAN